MSLPPEPFSLRTTTSDSYCSYPFDAMKSVIAASVIAVTDAIVMHVGESVGYNFGVLGRKWRIHWTFFGVSFGSCAICILNLYTIFQSTIFYNTPNVYNVTIPTNHLGVV